MMRWTGIHPFNRNVTKIVSGITVPLSMRYQSVKFHQGYAKLNHPLRTGLIGTCYRYDTAKPIPGRDHPGIGFVGGVIKGYFFLLPSIFGKKPVSKPINGKKEQR
jgi:hypothetical protein